MKIVNFAGSDGERFAVLLHEDGMPDFWANRWAVVHLRTNGQAANSISTKLPTARIPDLRVDQFGNLRWLGSGADCDCCQKKRPVGCVAGW